MRTAIGFLRPVGRAAVAVLRFGLQTLLAVILDYDGNPVRPGTARQLPIAPDYDEGQASSARIRRARPPATRM